MRKILFLCSQNKKRSLTAEKVFQNEPGIHVKSAGTERNARIKVTAGMLGWADLIVVMEKKHRDRLQQRYAEEVQYKAVVNLRIPDDFAFMEEALIELLWEKMEDYW